MAHVSYRGGEEKYLLGLVVNLEGEWEDNIKTSLRGKNAENADWIRLVHENKKCRAVVNKILNILFPWNGILLAK